jgi:uncharacterized membrane protein
MTAPRAPLARFGGWLGAHVAPWRFVLFLAVFAGAAAIMAVPGVEGLIDGALRHLLALPPPNPGRDLNVLADALISGFDIAVIVFAASLWPLGRDCSAATMSRHAGENDANRGAVLAISVIVSIVLLLALLVELPEARKGDVLAKAELVATLGLGWLFTNLVFMLHYAHMYYRGGPGQARGGLAFPGTREPDFWDFLYFSFTAGMSFAASDVDVHRGDIRKVVILQSLLSFVFNIGALAFCINVLASS